MKLLIVKFSPLPCYLAPLGPKYSPQYPILVHSQSTRQDIYRHNVTTRLVRVTIVVVEKL
jgi:hypothetical protein